MDGEGRSLAENEDVKEFYLGFSSPAAKLSRREIVSPPQALVVKYFDRLETRSPKAGRPR